MSENKLQTSATPFLEHLARPLLLFSGVLAGLLLVSSMVLLPRLTTVEVAGSLFTIQELRAHRTALLEDVRQAESNRQQFVLALHDEQYNALKESKNSVSPDALRDEILKVAASIVDQPDAVHIEKFHLAVANGTIELTGDVRFVSARSMTVLAEFVEALRHLPFVKDVTTPRYVRETTAGIGQHTPFTLTLHLQ